MFREEYRKANDSVHAPKSLLNAIKADVEASSNDLFDLPKKPRIWPRVLGYSGAVVAVAVLTILVIRPFGGADNSAGAPIAMQEAKAAEYEEAIESSLYDTVAEAEVSAKSALAPAAETGAAGSADLEAPYRMERSDGDEDEYYPAVTVPEQTYEDVFAMLTFADTPSPEADSGSENNAEIVGTTATVSVDQGMLNAFGTSFVLSTNGIVRALAQIGDRVFVIADRTNVVAITVYTKEGLLGEATQSGTYEAFEVKDTTVFEEDGSLSDYRVLLVTSRFTPDMSKAVPSIPESFSPMISDPSGARPLLPEEFTILDAGGAFNVYGAVEASERVRMLYCFAELGGE